MNAEWGCIPFNELKDIKTPGGIEVERELDWVIRPAKEVKEIVYSNPHWKITREPTEEKTADTGLPF